MAASGECTEEAAGERPDLPGDGQGAAEDEREEFTGLRIVNRTVTAEKVSQAIRGANRCVVPFHRVAEKCAFRRAREQTRDNVIIGVLYNTSNRGRLNNGEEYLRWSFTDMAEPRSRQIVLHLRNQAFLHWREKQHAATATRGSIFVILNPVFVEGGEGSMISAPSKDPLLRVERGSSLTKIGDCPSLGTCQMKCCNLPCNLEERERFCAVHLSMVYANKQVRTAAGGGADLATKRILSEEQKRVGKKLRHAVKAAEVEAFAEDAEEAERRARRVEEAKIARSAAAVQLDNRRFNSAEAKESYVNSIRRGQKPENSATSRVPMLGRGLDSSGCLELDIAELDIEEKLKAERMMERHCLGAAEPQVTKKRPRELPLPAEPQAAQSTPASRAEKQNLSDLVKAMSARRMARRAGLGSASSSDSKRKEDQSNLAAAAALVKAAGSCDPGSDALASGAPSAGGAAAADHVMVQEGGEATEDAAPECAEGAAAATDAAAPGEQDREAAVALAAEGAAASEAAAEASGADVQPPAGASAALEREATTSMPKVDGLRETAQVLMSDLEAAGNDATKLQKVLQAAGKLAVGSLQSESGQLLYKAVGQVSMRCERADVQRSAFSLRRTWRLALDAAKSASKSAVNETLEEVVAEVRAEEGGA